MSDYATLEKRPVVAAKNHICEFCTATIFKGDRHMYYRGVERIDHYFISVRRCMACYERLGQ